MYVHVCISKKCTYRKHNVHIYIYICMYVCMDGWMYVHLCKKKYIYGHICMYTVCKYKKCTYLHTHI